MADRDLAPGRRAPGRTVPAVAARLASLAALASVFASAAAVPAQQPAAVVPGANAAVEPIPITPRILPEYPIRLGGVFLTGLGGTPGAAADGTKLSDANRDWIAANCDVAALSPTSIDNSTFPRLVKAQKLFTPLLYLYASSLYDAPHRGSVGVWQPEMQPWTLRRSNGSEVPHPEPGGHWMDFANPDWASYWTRRINALTREYGAYGVVAAELPLGNTFVGSDLQRYHTTADRAAASVAWLSAVRKGYPNLLVPSAVGFDLAAGHPTPEPRVAFLAPALEPRLWNDFFPISDGGWCEGWVHPYWEHKPMAESLWETQLQAADRAGTLGQVFIAAAAYRNTQELEFALASFLLVVHNQGRAVFQPMPVRAGSAPDAGFSLATLQREVRERPNFFRIPLGRALQERHQIPTSGGAVWRRNFQFGDVYVNSDENKTVSVMFGGSVRRASGEIVRSVTLPPHTGAILLYTSADSRHKGSPATRPGKRPAGSRARHSGS